MWCWEEVVHVYKVEKLSRKDAAEISRVYCEVWPRAYEYPEEWLSLIHI